jgi:hypothetical protein
MLRLGEVPLFEEFRPIFIGREKQIRMSALFDLSCQSRGSLKAHFNGNAEFRLKPSDNFSYWFLSARGREDHEGVGLGRLAAD